MNTITNTGTKSDSAIDNSAEESSLEDSFQETLEVVFGNTPTISGEETELYRTIFFSGAQAILNAAKPLTRLADLQAEVEEELGTSDDLDNL